MGCPLLPLVWLNAVADMGSTDRCDGEDWVEFTNIGDTELALNGYMLHDDKGAGDSKAFIFGADDTIAAGATITLCKDAEGSFEFGIGGDDTVTLRDANGEMVDTSGELGDQGALNYVWTRGSPAGDWGYVVVGTLAPTSAPLRHSWGSQMDSLCGVEFDESADPNLNASHYPVLCVSLDTGGTSIVDEPKIPVNAVLGAAGVVLHKGVLGIEIRGRTSQKFPKKQYGFETWEPASGGGFDDVDIVLVGLPSEEDWIFHAPYADKTLLKNVLAYDLSRQMGQYASRSRWMVLSIDGDFKGVYVLMEKLKRNKQRINVSKNKDDDVSGGWIMKIDKAGPSETNPNWCFNTTSGVKFGHDYPDADDVTGEQREYIKTYLNEFEAALDAESQVYRDYIDIDSWVDYFMIIELTKEVDAYGLSAYFHKDRGGKLKAGPVWDQNLGFKNKHNRDLKGWAYLNPKKKGIPWYWPKLLNERGFVAAIQARWAVLRSSVFSLENINTLIDAYVQRLGSAIDANFDRWDVLEENLTHEKYIIAIKKWIQNRVIWINTKIQKLDPDWGVTATM